MRKTIKQEQAQYAWNCIILAKTKLGPKFSEYGQILQGSGAMILSCGLGQTVAFYYSQKKEHFNLILYQWASHIGCENSDEMIEKLMRDSSSYRLFTNKILSLLEWMKRFSKGKGD